MLLEKVYQKNGFKLLEKVYQTKKVGLKSMLKVRKYFKMPNFIQTLHLLLSIYVAYKVVKYVTFIYLPILA